MSEHQSIQTILLQTFFRLLYHEFSWLYDWVAWSVSLGMWQSWVLNVISFLPERNILELGHGPGHLLFELCSRDKKIIGLDLSPQMGQLVMKRLIRRGVLPKLVNGNSQYLPFIPDSFDHIVATFPTDYIMSPKTLEEVLRVLKPSGTLVVLPVAWITGSRWNQRLAALLFRVTGQTPSRVAASYQEMWIRPLEKAGFETDVVIKELETSEIVIVLAKKPIEYSSL